MKIQTGLLICLTLISLCSCATKPHIYAPPDPGKLKVSTTRVSVAVDKAHAHAREAKAKVDEATTIARQVATETRALKDVPPTLLQKINDLESKLNETSTTQAVLEKDLVEADQAKKQVEQDKIDYFKAAQKLADDASKEREIRIKREVSLHWYRVHWFLGIFITLGGIALCILWALLKFGIIAFSKAP